MKTACGKKKKCIDSKATWCIGHEPTFVDFEWGDDTCIYISRKGRCLNTNAWPENQEKKEDNG